MGFFSTSQYTLQFLTVQSFTETINLLLQFFENILCQTKTKLQVTETVCFKFQYTHTTCLTLERLIFCTQITFLHGVLTNKGTCFHTKPTNKFAPKTTIWTFFLNMNKNDMKDFQKVSNNEYNGISATPTLPTFKSTIINVQDSIKWNRIYKNRPKNLQLQTTRQNRPTKTTGDNNGNNGSGTI
uniref:Uncharacterized protein n=1 Tax=Cacopsylla melanoneura TaxID=428564 RepID=A0A8D8Y8P0_9HEMI